MNGGVSGGGGGASALKVPEVRVSLAINDHPLQQTIAQAAAATLSSLQPASKQRATYNSRDGAGGHGGGGGGCGGTVVLLSPGVVGAAPRRRHSWICG
ncbi:unnamed protein product [Macrosiphum euphorbiae]|uniref:Uncharacterized protein n=1 Tax=Macrosiphum euphorbiae TaxID=13131 RepID=A0AAV0XLB7_9HEMI|nr:unnamed protein product [Macrosiphum euphorbiae]